MATTGGPLGRCSDGGLLFARYAYPPNALGFCGPAGGPDLLEPAVLEGGVLRRVAARFEGAWPYLELIAAANGIGDPLDAGVVEAYWVGNGLLRSVPAAALADLLAAQHARSPVGGWPRPSPGGTDEGASPHHNFHVFSVYPWAQLLAESVGGDEPLRVLDRCRIRWGRVVETSGDEVVVEGRGLAWTGRSLVLGERRRETVPWRQNGRSLIEPPRRGDRVALHWRWVCDVLSPRQLAELRRQTAVQLAVANRALAPLRRAPGAAEPVG